MLREAVAEEDRRNEILESGADVDDAGYLSDHPHAPPTSDDSIPLPVPPSLPPPTPAPNSFTLPPNLTGEARRRARKKLQSKKNRQVDRAEKNAAAGFSYHDARPKTVKKYVSAINAVESSASMTQAKAARTAYVGINDKDTRDAHTYTLDELVGENSKFKFKLVKYRKGCVYSRISVSCTQSSISMHLHRVPIPIVSHDNEKYVIGVIADTPNDDSWPALMATAAKLLETAQKQCDLDDKDKNHRRGEFDTLRCGVSHGGGQTKPGNLCNKPVNAKIAKALNESEPFMRIAKFTTCKHYSLSLPSCRYSYVHVAVMATWAPKLYHYYVDRLGKLHAKDSNLHRNFSSSVFEATTYNLGPRTACYRHRDFSNLPFGLCAVTALGDFDYTKGGHLVLWEAHLVIEFPPGVTILLPSAIISHSNVPVADNEQRLSFTQYSAGGLFRWVDNHFQRAADYKATLKGDALVAYLAEEKARWKFGLGLLSRLDELGLLAKS